MGNELLHDATGEIRCWIVVFEGICHLCLWILPHLVILRAPLPGIFVTYNLQWASRIPMLAPGVHSNNTSIYTDMNKNINEQIRKAA